MHVRSIAALALFAAASPVGTAELVNGSFETGFDGWQTAGTTAVVDASFGSGPSENTFQAFLDSSSSASAASLESFLGLNSGSLQNISTGTPVQGSALRQTLTLAVGDVLSFDWNFLTNELTPPSNNDFAFFTFQSATLLADTTAGFSASSSLLYDGETGFRTVQLTVGAAGTYVLGFGVVDVDDSSINSGLLVDNVRVNGFSAPAIPEPSPLPALLAAGLVGGVLVRRHAVSR